MHPRLTKEIIETCRRREREGDCPTVGRVGGELLEDAVLELAGTNDRMLQTLAEAMRTFAPDLMEEFARRWNVSKAEADRRLDDFLAVLRKPVNP